MAQSGPRYHKLGHLAFGFVIFWHLLSLHSTVLEQADGSTSPYINAPSSSGTYRIPHLISLALGAVLFISHSLAPVLHCLIMSASNTDDSPAIHTPHDILLGSDNRRPRVGKARRLRGGAALLVCADDVFVCEPYLTDAFSYFFCAR